MDQSKTISVAISEDQKKNVGRKITSLQISVITVTLHRPMKRRPCIKLIVHGETKMKRDIGPDEAELRWKIEPNFTLHENETLTLRLCERPRMQPNISIAEVSLSYTDALERLERYFERSMDIELKQDAYVTIVVTLINSKQSDIIQEGMERVDREGGILHRLGKARNFLEVILGFGVALSELHPVSKAILRSINVAYKRLEDRGQCNETILQLAEAMACILGYVEDIEQFARISQLRGAIEDMQPLLEDTANFILRYTSRSGIEAILSSTDRDTVNGLKLRFEQFKQQFDRGISVQSALAVEKLLESIVSNHDDAILEELKPQGIDRSSPHQECMNGTREHILKQIDIWARDIDAPNILWLKGHPGVGKSAIASTFVEHLISSKRLGSSFFFQRDNATMTTPQALWRMVAFDLGRQYPSLRSSLVAKLRADEVRPTTSNIDKLFYHFIQEPIRASDSIPLGRLPVVVVDALDECGGFEGRVSTHRKNLLRTLKMWSNLPSKFKLLVTSRSEIDIEQIFQTCHHLPLEIKMGQGVDIQSSRDIEIFFKSEFQELRALYPQSLSLDWPGPQTLAELTKRAAGLFIWAKTIIRFINYGEPNEQLTEVLHGSGVGDMSQLYSRILNISFPKPTKQVIESFRSVFGAIILSKTPLPANTIARLRQIGDAVMEDICTRMRSVLDFEGSIRISHQSFSDFLLDQSSCPTLFFINREEEIHQMATACLRTMKEQLKFNICTLESSHLRNEEIDDLPLRIETCISTELSYSCLSWADYLAKTSENDTVLNFLHYFIYHDFLFWLEILSLYKRVGSASIMLQALADWMKDNNNYASITRDMRKFAITFAGVISESAPHIYLSALPFSPPKSEIYRNYIQHYPRTVKIAMGGQSDWPAKQKVLLGHTDSINCIAISPDGRYIASGSRDMSVLVWDAETGRVVAGPFEEHNSPVGSVAFSQDSRSITSASESHIHIWNIETGEMISLPVISDGDWFICESMALSPDDRLIACASASMNIRLWDTEKDVISSWSVKGYIQSLAFSPDGKFISGSTGALVRLWDTESRGSSVMVLKGHKGDVNSVAFSPDGKYVASGSNDHTIILWSIEIGDILVGPIQGHKGPITSVAFSRDGGCIVSGSADMTVRVWDIKTGRMVAGPFEGHTDFISSVAASPDGKRILSGSEDFTICVWDTEMDMTTVSPFEGHTHSVKSVCFSRDGKRIVSGSSDKTIYIWDSMTGGVVVGPLVGHSDWILSVTFSPDDKHIASGSVDNTIRVWDSETGVVVAGPFIGHNNWVKSVAFSPDGTRIVSGSSDLTICIWDINTSEKILGPFEAHTDWVQSVQFSPDGKTLASGSTDCTVCIWDAETGERIGDPLEGHKDVIYCVQFSPDGRYIASSSDDCTIRLWDVKTGQSIMGPFKGHTNWVNSISFSPDGKYIASGSEDMTVRLWDAENGKVVAGPFEGHTNWVNSVSFSPDGKHIASGSADWTIRIWNLDMRDKTPIEPEGNTKPVGSLTSPLVRHKPRLEPLKGTLTSYASHPVQFLDCLEACEGVPPGMKMVNGWILGPGSELILWVPPELHRGLFRPESPLVIGRTVKTKLNLKSFVHGPSWTLCKGD